MLKQNLSKILVIGPSWIGDMVMAQSLFIKLKHLYPNSKIVVTAPNWSLPLLSRMPEIDEAIPNPFGHGDFSLVKRIKMGRELQKYQFDLAIVLPNSLKSSFVPFFAKIKKRRGLLGEQRYIFLNQILKIKKIISLMVERYNALAFDPKEIVIKNSSDLGTIFKPNLLVDHENLKQTKIQFNLTQNNNILGICPGAEYGPAKRWPLEYFAKIAEIWIKNNGYVYIFGSQKDDQCAQKISSLIPTEYQNNCISLTGKTTIPQVIDLLSDCRLVVTNDSGLMHVTASVGTPLIALYGSTTTSYTPPLSDNAKTIFLDIKCRPCFKRVCELNTYECLKLITPQIVIDNINNLLNLDAENKLKI